MKAEETALHLQPLPVKMMKRLQLSGLDSSYHILAQSHLRLSYRLFCAELTLCTGKFYAVETNDAMSHHSKDSHDTLNSQNHSSCGPPVS